MNAPDPLSFHAFRRTGIGGSDAASVLNMSPWKSPTALFLEKLGELPPMRESDAMRWGKLLEPLVREEYMRHTGYKVEICEPLRHSHNDFMIAHLDGRVAGRHRRVLEVKTSTSYDDWGEPGTDAVPTPYLIQCLHYLAVTGEEMADLAVLIAGRDFRIYEIHRSTALESLLVEAEREFWGRVKDQKPPEPRTLADVNLRWRQATTRSVELEGPARKALISLRGIRKIAADLASDEAEAEKAVKLALADADTGTIDGAVAVTWRQTRDSTMLDSERVKVEYPQIFAACQRERGGTRRFLVKG